MPNGTETSGQTFFDVIETISGDSIGFLWLGFQTRFGRKIASINDINIASANRGKGVGKALMKLVEDEARRCATVRIRLHVFHTNQIAKNLYLAMGFEPTNLDMRKDI